MWYSDDINKVNMKIVFVMLAWHNYFYMECVKYRLVKILLG